MTRRRIRTFLRLLLLASPVIGCASGSAGSGVAPTAGFDPARPLRPGDAIEVSFSREPDLSGTYAVDETGHVSLPLLGLRRVVDTPATALRTELMEGFQDQLRNQSIQISLLRRVRVLGAVNDPGLYHADRTMTLGDVIALAGGASQTGNLEKVRIQRNGREIEASVGGPVNYQLQSGDQIIVPEKSWVSRNTVFLVGVIIGVAGVITRL